MEHLVVRRYNDAGLLHVDLVGRHLVSEHDDSTFRFSLRQMFGVTAFITLTLGIVSYTAVAEDESSAGPFNGQIFATTIETKTEWNDEHWSGPTLLMRVDPNTGQTTTLCQREDPISSLRCSPNGRKLAFINFDKSAWVCDARDGAKPSKVCDNAISIVWSPDGHQLLITVLEEHKIRLADNRLVRARRTFLVDLDGSHRSSLSVPQTHKVLDWSLDRNRLLTILSGRCKPWSSPPTAKEVINEMYVLHRDGTVQSCLTEEDDRSPHGGRFSPDGRHVAFWDAGPRDARPWQFTIRLVNIDGTNRQTIIQQQDATAIRSLCWSPDGKFLAAAMQDNRKNWFGYLKMPARYMEIFDLTGDRQRVIKPTDTV